MLSSSRITFLLFCLVLSVVGVFSQDLGSSNKLFRAPESKSNPAPTKRAAPKKAVSTAVKSKTPAKPKPKTTVKIPTTAQKSTVKSSTTAQKTKPPTNTAKNAVKNNGLPTVVNQPVKTSPQNNQIANIVITAGQPTSGDYDELFEEAIADGNAARDARDYMKAEGAYLRAQSLKTKDSRAVYGLGNLYLSLIHI